MNELHLFAGAGGGILGGLLLGHTCRCAVEIEPFRRQTLLQRQRDGILPRFPIWDDVRTFDGRPWRGQIDAVCGGFPCQDISAANSQAVGITGPRSGLWKQMLRIAGEVGPRIIFVENSPMLVGRGLGVVLGDLATLGYDAVWGVLGADDLGAFHKRERLFIMGHRIEAKRRSGELIGGDTSQRIDGDRQAPSEFGKPSQVCFVGHGNSSGLAQPLRQSGDLGAECEAAERAGSGVVANGGQLPAGRAAESSEAQGGRSFGQSPGCGDAVANCASERRPEGWPQPNEWARQSEASICGGDCLWLDRQFLHCRDGKIRATKPGLCGVAHGMANRMVRISAIGDGQVPVVVAAVWTTLATQLMS